MMSRSTARWGLGLLTWCLGTGALLGTAAPAAEPAAKFLEALRAEGYFDVAVDYIESMANSPQAPVEFRETIDYQRGLTLVEWSRVLRDQGVKEKRLNEAQAALQNFLNQLPDHALADAAKNHLGNLLVERGRAKVDRARRSGGDAEMTEARKLFDEAYQVFDTSKNVLMEKLAVVNKRQYDPKREPEKIEARNQMRADYLQAQLLSAAVLEEQAATYPDGSPKFKEVLTKSAAEYDQIYEKYRTRIAGMYARLYQARCLSKTEQHNDALSYLTELLDQPDDAEAIRGMKVKALSLAIDSWVAQKQLAEAVNRGVEYVKTVRPNETRTNDWLELRMKVAQAAKTYIDELRAKNPKDAKVRLLTTEARNMAQFVSRYKNDYQQDARRLLAELRGGEPGEDEPERPEPTTFADAAKYGQQSMQAADEAKLVLRLVPPRLAKEKDPAIRKELEEQIAASKDKYDASLAEAREYFEKSLGLVTRETKREDLNIVRYYLCFLMFQAGEYYESAILGEFVTQRFPESSGARPCAKIALASYIRIFAGAPEDDRQFETDRIIGVSNYIIEKWPDQPEAQDALNTLIPFMIQAKQLEKAQEYVKQIPEDSPKRGDAELRTGQAMWSEYLRLSQLATKAKTDTSIPAPDVQEMDQLKARSEKVLADGIARMEKTEPNSVLISAAVSLAQIYVDTGQPAKAIELLEKPNIGAIKLASDGHESTNREGVPGEIYKTALRAYIGSLAVGADPTDTLAKARDMMTKLKASVGEDATSLKKLVAIYVGLARDLKQQLELADDAAKPALLNGFETFLKQVGAESNEFTALNWVADTFSNTLAAASLSPTGGVTPAARRYYEEANKIYEKILAMGKTPGFFPANLPGLEMHFRLQLARSKRDLQEFTAAKALLVELLKVKEINVNVQIEAAKTYQEWAAVPGKEDLYGYAINGAEPQKDDKNLIWGWSKLAQITNGKKDFLHVHYEARYNIAVAQHQWGLALSGEPRIEKLNIAKRNITLMARLDPEMGGEEWKPKFDVVLKSIQRELGEKVTGLATAEDPAAAGGGSR